MRRSVPSGMHFTNASVLDLRYVQIDRRAGRRVLGDRSEAVEEGCGSQCERSSEIVVLEGARHAGDLGRAGADPLGDVAP